MTQTTHTDHFATLHDHAYMNLHTFRKNGQAVKTPVWFAQDNDRLYVMTINHSGKVKRIRNNGRVEVGPSDRGGAPLGPTVNGAARILAGAEAKQANSVLNHKYGWQKRMFDVFMKLTRREQVYLEIAPDGA